MARPPRPSQPRHPAPRRVAKAPPAAPRGPGRPKLGVVAREITLLPRHWDWLAQQKGGASVAIRRLVDEARRASGLSWTPLSATRSPADTAIRS